MSYIAKVKAVSHGANVLRYILGESSRKQHPELILRVAEYNLESDLPATVIWDSMTDTQAMHQTRIKQLKNTLLRGELCPDPTQWFKETANLNQEQIRQHAQSIFEKFRNEFAREDKRRGWPALNLKQCQTVVVLHMDSGKPHIHFAINRIDGNGKTLRDKDLDVRAFQAAEKLARSENKKTAKEISVEKTESKLQEITRTPEHKTFTADCYDALKSFKSFNTKSDFDNYVSLLRNKGYEVKVNTDAQGISRGYSLSRAGVKITASNLGHGKNLLVRNLEKTWEKLQNEIELERNHSYTKNPDTINHTIKKLPDYLTLKEWKKHVAQKQSETDVIWSLNKKNKKGENENWKFAIPSKLNKKLLMEFPEESIKNKIQLCGTAINKFIWATEFTKEKNRNDETFMDECIQHAKKVCGIKPKPIEKKITKEDAYKLLSNPIEGYKLLQINNIEPILDKPGSLLYLPESVVNMFTQTYDQEEYTDNNNHTYTYYTTRDTIDGVQEAVSEFMGLFISAVMSANSPTPSGGGGGGSSDLPWRGNKDDNGNWPIVATNCLVNCGVNRSRRKGGLHR